MSYPITQEVLIELERCQGLPPVVRAALPELLRIGQKQVDKLDRRAQAAEAARQRAEYKAKIAASQAAAAAHQDRLRAMAAWAGVGAGCPA